MLLRNPRGPMTRFVMMAAAMGLFVVGYYWGNQYKLGDPTPPAIAGILVRPPIELPGFELRDTEDQRFTGDVFDDHWTLLTFGDLSRAPGHLAVTRMIEVYNRLAHEPELQAILQIALIAEYQDQALARDFGRLSPALKLLSGESSEILRLSASLGASPKHETGTADGQENTFFLIDPEGRLLALFPSTQPPAAIASDLSALAAHPERLYPTDD